MVRVLVSQIIVQGKRYIEAAGLSTDTKPTGDIITGSKFTEADTGIEYLFDESSGGWQAQNTGNGRSSIAGATVTLGLSPKYDGTEKTQTVSSVKIGASTLTENTDYKVQGNKGTEIGAYTLRIVGIGSYAGTLYEAWEIVKGTGSVVASPDSLSLTAEGDAGTSTLTVTGDGEISVESSAEAVATASVSGTTVTVTPLTAGSATVTVTLAETEHYSGDTDTISVTVEAASDPEEGGE